MTFGVTDLAYPHCHFGEDGRAILLCLVVVWSMLVPCCQARWGSAEVDQRSEYAAGWQAGTLLTWSLLNVTRCAERQLCVICTVRFCVLQNKRLYSSVKVDVHWRPSFRAIQIQKNYIYTV
jgi:hypothetical protein